MRSAWVRALTYNGCTSILEIKQRRGPVLGRVTVCEVWAGHVLNNKWAMPVQYKLDGPGHPVWLKTDVTAMQNAPQGMEVP